MVVEICSKVMNNVKKGRKGQIKLISSLTERVGTLFSYQFVKLIMKILQKVGQNRSTD